MSKLQRNRQKLSQLMESFTDSYNVYKAVIEVIGDDEEIILDWDDLMEATGLSLEKVENVLEDMEANMLITVDFEEGVIS